MQTDQYFIRGQREKRQACLMARTQPRLHCHCLLLCTHPTSPALLIIRSHLSDATDGCEFRTECCNLTCHLLIHLGAQYVDTPYHNLFHVFLEEYRVFEYLHA